MPQPTGTITIDTTNPITSGLQLTWVGSSPNALQGPGGATIAHNTLGSTTTSFGAVGVAGSAAGGTGYLATAGHAMFLANQWTALAYCDFTLVAGNNAVSSVATPPGSGTQDRSLYVFDGHESAYIYDGGQKAATDAAVTLATLTPYVLSASSNGSSIKAWRNGANVASVATSNGGYGYGGTPPQLSLGFGIGSGAYNAGSSMRIALYAWWTRELSGAEQASLAANPWQLFVGGAAVARPQVFVCT
jgi:hypothetical protein